MNARAGSLPWIMPVGLFVALGLSAAGFQYLAVHAFEVGTAGEYIPQLKTSPAKAKCVRQR
jgi:hypothetical protein